MTQQRTDLSKLATLIGVTENCMSSAAEKRHDFAVVSLQGEAARRMVFRASTDKTLPKHHPEADQTHDTAKKASCYQQPYLEFS
jgi:hypothetical protein